MAKCPICNRSFEPTDEEIVGAKPWSVNICSRQCWCKINEGVNPLEHRFEYHVGEVGPQPECGGILGSFDVKRIPACNLPRHSKGVMRWGRIVMK